MTCFQIIISEYMNSTLNMGFNIKFKFCRKLNLEVRIEHMYTNCSVQHPNLIKMLK